MRKDESSKQIPPRNVSTEYSEAEQLASGPEAKRIQKDTVKVTSAWTAGQSSLGKGNDVLKKRPSNTETEEGWKGKEWVGVMIPGGFLHLWHSRLHTLMWLLPSLYTLTKFNFYHAYEFKHRYIIYESWVLWIEYKIFSAKYLAYNRFQLVLANELFSL